MAIGTPFMMYSNGDQRLPKDLFGGRFPDVETIGILKKHFRLDEVPGNISSGYTEKPVMMGVHTE
jgi:hypothetical protein